MMPFTRDSCSVVLASMPWTTVVEPSLGLGILKGRLDNAQIPARVCHLNLLLLRHLSIDTYVALGATWAVNDFLFTHELDSEITREQESRLYEACGRMHEAGAIDRSKYPTAESWVEAVLIIRRHVIPSFLAHCVATIGETRPTLLGLTCLFDQTIASVALARAYKELFPDTLIALGGYALEGPPGRQVMDSFPWIDVVARGAGEGLISKIAEASVDRTKLAMIPRLIYRREPYGEVETTVAVGGEEPIELSPIPDYGDYFRDVEALASDDSVRINVSTLPIETSRGCWWGQVSHCVFCGIDDETIKYKQKTPERTLHTLRVLRDRHDVRSFRISDYILPITYFKTLLPTLAEQGKEFRFSCEIKANMNLEKFTLLRDAGFVEVQPGIESFSDPVLNRMGKGVSGIQNIQTLLLGQRLGITVHYNLLYGFPGDRPEEYHKLVETLPYLYHLRPPVSVVPVLMTRFAPLQANPERFGMSGPLVHHQRYEVLFSQPYQERIGFNFDNYCYYFERPYEHSAEMEELFAIVEAQVDHWRRLHSTRRPEVSFELAPHGIIFTDSRYGVEPRRTAFSSLHAAVYQQIDGHIRRPEQISDKVAGNGGEDIYRALEELRAQRLIYQDARGRLIGMALPPRTDRPEKEQHASRWAPPFTTTEAAF